MILTKTLQKPLSQQMTKCSQPFAQGNFIVIK